MNKYQEALDGLKDTKCDEINNCKQCSLTSYCGHYQCIKTLQELVDKETPKKPKIEQQNDYVECHYVCSYELAFWPECGLNVDFGDDYCKRCGQKLDWSDELDWSDTND